MCKENILFSGWFHISESSSGQDNSTDFVTKTSNQENRGANVCSGSFENAGITMVTVCSYTVGNKVFGNFKHWCQKGDSLYQDSGRRMDGSLLQHSGQLHEGARATVVSKSWKIVVSFCSNFTIVESNITVYTALANWFRRSAPWP